MSQQQSKGNGQTKFRKQKKNFRNKSNSNSRQAGSSSKGQKTNHHKRSTAKPENDQQFGLFQSFVRGLATSSGAQFTSNLGSTNGKEDSRESFGKPNDFDFFAFAQSWAPRFCCTNNKQCKQEKLEGYDDLAVHGIWPMYSTARKDGRTYPQNCPNPAFEADAEALSRGRQQHEWSKHGVCTSYSPRAYIETEDVLEDHDVIFSLRDLLNESAGDTVSVRDLVEAAGGQKRVAIMSNKSCQLQEITTCWSKRPDGSAGEPIDCPDHVLGSSRNNAILFGCRQLALDQAGEACSVVSKDMAKAFKAADKG